MNLSSLLSGKGGGAIARLHRLHYTIFKLRWNSTHGLYENLFAA